MSLRLDRRQTNGRVSPWKRNTSIFVEGASHGTSSGLHHVAWQIDGWNARTH